MSETKSKIRSNNLLILGTWMAGIGSIFLSFVEVGKHFHSLLKIGFGWVLSIQLMTLVFVSLLSFLAGAALVVIIQHTIKPQTKDK